MTWHTFHPSERLRRSSRRCWNVFKRVRSFYVPPRYAYPPQGMERNRDDFYVITCEIGSLIDSVIQYGRNREAMSDGYKRVCSDFLRRVHSPSWDSCVLVNCKSLALYRLCNPEWSRFLETLGSSSSAFPNQRRTTRFYLLASYDLGACEAISRYRCRKFMVNILTE